MNAHSNAKLTPVSRAEMVRRNFRELPFARLSEVVPRMIDCHRRVDSAALAVELTGLRIQLDACHKALDLTTGHLEKYGVSPGLVYQIERMRAQLLRVERLVELLTAPRDSAGRFSGFLGELIRDNQESRSLRSLFGDTSAQLARRIVERNAETGEHYIARTRADYFAMLRHAAGGGAVTAVTMMLKVLIVSAGMSHFFTGAFASLDYAASFVLIQMLGFTLATKQPANTAPALARQMHEVRDPARMEGLVDEIACLVRSQAAAIIGNIALVVPIRARRLHAPERHLIYGAVVRRLVSKPLSFLLPEREPSSAQSKSEQLMK